MQSLIFDFDGLIVDTEKPGFDSWNELYTEFDQKLTLDDWRKATGYVGGFDPGLHLEAFLGRQLDWGNLSPKKEARNLEFTLKQGVFPRFLALIQSPVHVGI